jgi:hypothetical protein
MSNSTAVAPVSAQSAGDIMERVIAVGDLSKLQPEERVLYYNRTCESLGLNPLTRPFEYITLNGKLTLYARKDCTDQLRSLKRVSVAIVDRQRIEDIYAVTARATMPDGRTDESIGAVPIAGLKGDNLANALMKAETKAKRRVTLSICGLGMLDESELETIPATARAEPAQSPRALDRTAQGLAACVKPPAANPDPDPYAERVGFLRESITAWGRETFSDDPAAFKAFRAAVLEVNTPVNQLPLDKLEKLWEEINREPEAEEEDPSAPTLTPGDLNAAE